MHSQVVAAPRVTLFVTGAPADPSFVPTGAAGGHHPLLLDADNLREAAVQAGRLRGDGAGDAPPALLRIDTTAPPPVAHTSGRCDHTTSPRRAIAFPESPRQLAGLIADAARVGVAEGAVIAVAGGPAVPQRFRADVAAHLEQAGFEVAFDVPGWVLEDARISLSG